MGRTVNFYYKIYFTAVCFSIAGFILGAVIHIETNGRFGYKFSAWSAYVAFLLTWIGIFYCIWLI